MTTTLANHFNVKPRRPSPERKGYGLYVLRDGAQVLMATNETEAGIRNTAGAMGLTEYTIRPVKMAAAWEDA